MLVTWTACGLLIVPLHATYRDYLTGTHWLIVLLGPATVAFAVPIHRHRALIRHHWGVLSIGVIAGSALAVASSWILAGMFDLTPELRASLLPRSGHHAADDGRLFAHRRPARGDCDLHRADRVVWRDGRRNFAQPAAAALVVCAARCSAWARTAPA